MSWKKLPESVLLDKNVDYHRELNPVAWNGTKMRGVVRHRLLDIADKFVEFLALPKLKVQDIVLTGSNANYNWTEFSDFDIHVIVNYADITSDEDLALQLFNAKKELWNTLHDIKIRGYDVELYVEDTATPPVSQGVFSLEGNAWIREPSYHKPALDDAAIESKVIDLMLTIDHLIDSESDDIDDYSKLIDKIKKMRRSGLAEHGEFSTENMAFKVLRNEGYIAKLHHARKAALDNSLTLETEF